MRKRKAITCIVVLFLVVAVFLLAGTNGSIRRGTSNKDNAAAVTSEAENIGEADVPLASGNSDDSTGGVFVFSGDEDEDEEEAGGDEQGGEAQEDTGAESEDANGVTAEEQSDEDLVQRTLQANIVDDTAGSGGFLQRIRRFFGASGAGTDEDVLLEGMVPEDAVAEAIKEDISIEGETVLVAFDIKIYANEEEKEDGSSWQPSEDNITVNVRSDSLKDAELVDIYHLEDGKSTPVFVGTARIRNGEASFEAESFSIYIIAVHEGDEAITPRVVFHYIARESQASSDEDSGATYYTSGFHEFSNKAGSRQNSQTLADGDVIESVEAPKSSTDSRFYGWYTVDAVSDEEAGNVTYSWPDDTKRIEAGSAVSIAENGNGSITWSLGDAGGTARMDGDGCVHVYLAPIYENYHFVNFHLGQKDTDNGSNILSRKLIVLGRNNTADVLISDKAATSEDPDRKAFIGWEGSVTNSSGDNEFIVTKTLDEDGKTIDNRDGRKGTYLTVGNNDVDLYPVYAEIRWINYNVGENHNGASYVAPKYYYSSDNIEGDVYPITGLPVASRIGYTFSGWYTEQDGTGEQITDGEGSVLNKTYSGSGRTYELKGGSLYVYNALDSLTLYAKWTPAREAPYKVIIWKQKVNDSKDAVDEEKTYDYYTYFDRTCKDTSKPVSPDKADLQYASSNPKGDFTGFELGRYDSNVTVDPQGSTILNVYYDRKMMEIRFIGFPAYKKISGSPDSKTQYYTLADGTYVRLSRSSGGLWNSSTSYYYLSYNGEAYGGTVYSKSLIGSSYSEASSPSYNSTYYGAIDGYYRALTWTQYKGSDYYTQASDDLTWTGLYQQTFEMNDYSWDDVSAYQWKENSTNTIQTLMTGFTQDTNPYELTYNGVSGSSAIYHYKQGLDGTYSEDAAFTAHSKNTSGAFNFSNKFEGFTVSSYATSFNESGSGTSVGDGSSASVTYPIHVYHKRNSGYTLSFTPNYPSGTDTADLSTDPKVYTGLAYEQPLAAYADTAAPAAPENYMFDGWYEDASGTVPFDFENSIMPAGNKVVYAKWSLVKYRVMIDPEGGIIDHIDYTNETYRRMLEPTGLTGNGYVSSFATYFNNTATEYITVNEEIRRGYVEITNAEAAAMEAGTVYRYVNMQYIEDYGSCPADARNAVYILDTPESISAYYSYYCKVIEDKGEGTPIPRALWESKYLSSAKYRALRAGESYRLLGWYESDAFSKLADSTYDLTSPTLKDTMLKAVWRLEGGYTISYTTEYYASNGDIIKADLDSWTDPGDGARKYSDQGVTQAMQEPYSIEVNGKSSDAYQFLGWQIVRVDTIAGKPHYTPLEQGVYYTAGQPMTVRARYADENLVIHMQAVYEKRGEAVRRPSTASLILDAAKDAAGNGRGYIDEEAGNGVLPSLDAAGTSYINTDDHLDSGKPTQIVIGDLQSNTPLHLSRYAAENYFRHTENYSLIGFDDGEADTDYIPDYAADAVIAMSPGSGQSLYAVWEPAAYMTFVNDTGVGDVVFRISGSGKAMRAVNIVDGEYSRTPVNTAAAITVGEGETLKLAIPEGIGEEIKITGTVTLGMGYNLTAKSMLGGGSRTLTGTLTGSEADYTRVVNGEEFGFSDVLEADVEGVTVTFTAEKAPHTLVLQDNYKGNGSGGGKKEIQFAESSGGKVFYNEENVTSYDLPSTGTRIGYEFAGWDPDYAADTAEFSETAGWKIKDLTAFFGGEEARTLYAVWKTNSEASSVYIWKDVPEPGDQNKEFSFDIEFSGSFSYQENTNGKSSGWSGNKTESLSTGNCKGSAAMRGTFTLKHGEYLKVTSTKDERSGNTSYPSLKIEVQKYDASGNPAGSSTELGWEWKYVNYNNTGSSYRHRNFSFSSVDISVTEEDCSDKYDTSIDIAAQTTDYPLTAADADRRVSWTDTYAGGTVIFTDTRRTADVTVRSTLLPESAADEEFEITAAFYSEDGESAGTQYETYVLEEDSRSVLSGIGEWTLLGIPTGAVIEFTQSADQERFTTSAAGLTVLNGEPVADLNTDAGNVFRFTVTGDTDVEFTNILRSQKVRIMAADENGEALDSAEFTFPGVYDGTRYSAEGTGLIWEDTAYAGTYSLTETGTNRLYERLPAPSEIVVSASGVRVSENTDYIRTSGPDEDGYYTITVINPRLMQVTVRNEVTGDNTDGMFGYTVTVMQGGGPVAGRMVTDDAATDDAGKVMFTLVHNQSVKLYIPRNAEIIAAETADDGYYTWYQVDDGDRFQSGHVQIRDVSRDMSILFTNEARPPAPTGVSMDIVPYILIGLGAVVMIIFRKRRIGSIDDSDDEE